MTTDTILVFAILGAAAIAVASVVSPGSYRFLDFVKVGTPLLALAWLVAIAVIPLLFPW